MKLLTFIMSRVIQTAWADVVETEAHSVFMTEHNAQSKAHFDAAQKEATEKFPPTDGWQVANVTSSHIEGDALRNLFVVISSELGGRAPVRSIPITMNHTSKEATALIATLNKVSEGTADARIAMTKLGSAYREAAKSVAILASATKAAHHEARLVALAMDDKKQVNAICRGYLAGLGLTAQPVLVDEVVHLQIVSTDGDVVASQRCEKGDSLDAITIKLCEGLVSGGREFDRDQAIIIRLMASGMFDEGQAIAALAIPPALRHADMLTCPAHLLINFTARATPSFSE